MGKVKEVVESVNEVFKIDFFKIFAVMALIFGLICPGLLIIYLYKYDIFVKIDVLKLIMFSFSLNFPVILLNIFLHTLFPILSRDYQKDAHDNNELIIDALASCSVYSSMQIYISLVISWLLKLSFKSFAIILIVLIIIVTAGLIILLSIKERKTKNNSISL